LRVMTISVEPVSVGDMDVSYKIVASCRSSPEDVHSADTVVAIEDGL
jgi:hypothetical protein